MLNIFYGYSIAWGIILFFYSLGWSNLCVDLNKEVSIFLVFSIVTSFILGKIMKNNFKFIMLKENPHKSDKTTKILLIFYAIDMIYSRTLPIFQVIKGNSYGGYNGIPIIHVLLCAFSIFYSTYLAYIFICFKQKKCIVEYLCIISYFIILMQRQNIFICLVLGLNVLVAGQNNNILIKIKKNKIKVIAIVSVIMLIILYVFGIFGNVRYRFKLEVE